ncbi:hypothetical protein LAZ67_11001074, partial [Cordylochernes scorpioides]
MTQYQNHIPKTYKEAIEMTTSNWRDGKYKKKSVTGYLFTVGDNLISWNSKFQAQPSLSTCDSELQALLSCYFLITLQLRQGAKPSFTPERNVPYALREKVEKELDTLEAEGISKTASSDWGSPLVVIPKGEGTVRLCVDYKVGVNDQLVNASYRIKIIEDVLNSLKDSKYFCRLDLYKAYLHLKTDEESSSIQTILRYIGTYRMNRLSFGIKTAPAEFNRVINQILQGLNKTISYFDDILVHGKSKQECKENIFACLERLRACDLHLNKNKCIYFQTKIEYLGHVIENNKISKSPSKVKAIIDMPQPKNIADLRRFLGMITYYYRFLPDVSTITYPLRRLLKKDKKFFWSAQCQKAFIKLKNEVASDRVLIPFDTNLPVTLTTDASPVGIAAVLSDGINKVEHPIAFASRSLTDAEQNYSQLDREALAIVFGVDNFFDYLFGHKFTLITDNQPLTRIFHPKSKFPKMTSARLLRYTSFLAGLDYVVSFKKGTGNQIADCLPQAPTAQVEEIVKETDKELSKLKRDIKSNSIESDYTLNGEILVKNDKVVVPKSLQLEVLKDLHSTHLGIVKMKQLARRYCTWKNIDKVIENLVKSCKDCLSTQNNPPKAPVHHWDPPSTNWERIHLDYAGPFQGYYYLVLIYAKSRWAEIKAISEPPTSLNTIKLLNDIFSTHGYPFVMVSDNASIFTGDTFSNYCLENGIRQKFIAPGHPATNGLAERNVQTLKNKLKSMINENVPIHQKIQKILLRYRATPLASGRSPSEMYLNRQIRIKLDAMRPYQEERSQQQIQPRTRCLQAYERNGLYILSQINCPKALATREICIAGEKNYEKWHSRFGHLNLQDLKKLKMQNIVYGLPNFDVKNFTCEVCLKGKQTRLPFQKESFTRSREPLELVHTDICGPMRTKSLGGALYFSTFIDDFSGFIFTFIMKSRSEVFKGFRIYKRYAEKQTEKRLKCIRSDNAPEYLSKEFKNYLEEEGIGHQLSVEYTPQQNGVAERANRTLLDMTRCFMIEGDLPETLWAELIHTSTYIRNRCPKLNECKTPHELFTKRKPVVSHLRIIGCKSLAVNNRPNRSKFAPRSEEYKLIGYFTESKAYRLWKPGTRTIIKSKDLKKKKGSTSEVKSRTEIESESDLEMSDLVDEPSESEVVISRRGRGRPRYIRTGKPGRPRKEYPTANLSTQELLEAKYLPDPKHAEEALSGRDSYFWKKAMEEEFDSLIENKTWELVDPPKNRNIIGSKWVFKTKCNSDGSVERHKARLVAKGYSQQYGIDYEETFAPVVRQSTIRMLLALAVEYNLILHQMDVQSAYLNGEIKEEIYMTQPENFVSRKYPERVCRLKKAIYGLKQAGIVWHERLDNELKNLGLKQLQSNNCVYIKHDEGILLVAIYVDDLIIAAEREDTLKSFKEIMKRIFKIKDLGGINCCLGIRIQMKEDGSISIDQERYIEELLAKYRMKEAKPISTPMDSNSKLTKISSIEVSTRPDIAYAVSALGQFSNDPRRQHWNAAKRVLRYLKGTSCLRITYRKSNEALHGYVDADWGGNLVDRKSHTGIVYFLARGPIAWESKKQQTVTLSSTEYEYIALCEAGKEAVYLRALLDEMGFDMELNVNIRIRQRSVTEFLFKSGDISATTIHSKLQPVHGNKTLDRSTIQKRVQRFQKGDFDLHDKERPDKLKDSENFDIWKFQINIIFKANNLIEAINGKLCFKDQKDEKEKNAWIIKDAKAQIYIISSIDKTILTHIIHCENAKSMYDTICRIFERDDEQSKCKLLQEFHTYKFDKNVDLVANISNLRNLAFKLNNLKQNFDDNIVISKILTILPEDYNYFCTAWESTGKDEKTIENLISRLTTEEIRRNRQSQPEDRVAMNATKQKVCFTCNKPGHISKNCTQRKFCKFCKKTNHEEKDCFFKNNSKPAAKVNKEQCRICKKFNHKEKDCYFRNKEKQPPIAFIAEQREEYDKRSSVTFIVDSGSTCHMINEEKLLDHQKKCDVNINVAKKEEVMRAKTSGQFKGRQCNLNEVIFVPELSKNLLSVTSIVNNGGEVNFKGDKVTILKDGKKVLEGDQLENGLYAVNIEQHFSKKNDSNLTLPSENKTKEWHRKLGHIGMQNLRKLESLVDGMELNKLEKQENDVCEICIMAKQTRKSFGNERSRATRPLEIVHTDLCGPIEPLTHDNKKYIMTFLDDYTHFCYVYLLSNKYEAKEYIKEYVNEVERFLNAKVSKLRCDNGGEYANTQVKEWCKMKGIILDFTVPYTPQLNGKAERLNRTLIEKTRALLLDSKLNKEMWGEATRVAAYLINRSPSNTIQTTPAQMWFGRKPNLSNVKLFGSEVYVKKLGNLKKLDSKSEKYSLIGYSGNGYRLWDMQKKRIIIARDVVFTGKLTNEMTSVIQPRYREDLDSEIEESQDTKMELDTHDKPQNSTNSRYMLRNRENINRPERLKDYEVLNSVSGEIGLLTYNEAVTGVDKENWVKAIQEEKDSLKKNETWDFVKAECVKELIYIKALIEELTNETILAKLNIDNQSAMTLMKTGQMNRKTKHID